MMKAVIIDDETKGIEVLRMLLESHCPNVRVIGHAEDVKNAISLINYVEPEIIFLDIEMSGQTGFDILEKVNVHNFHVIFVTAHSQYAVKAFRYSVADYLLKPVDFSELKDAVEKVQHLIMEKPNIFNNKREEDTDSLTLRIPIQNRVVLIKMIDIIRLEADGAYTRIFINGNKEYVSSYNLKVFEEQLLNTMFFRVHRSHIINLFKIVKLVGEKQIHVTMSDNSEVEIARRHKPDFLTAVQIHNLLI